MKLRTVNLLFITALLVAACGAPQPTPAPSGEQPLYLALVWHQHQPLYYKDADDVYTRPWARVHGTKDYYDMAATVAQYPNVHVTFNLTPVLLKQLDDFVTAGAKDKYWVLSEKPAAELTEADKDFILRRFFDANWDHVIKLHPGYQALLDKRGGATDEAVGAALQSFSEQDFRDLQIWFNLAWMDPDELAQEPLQSLVAKDHGFVEADKTALFAAVKRILAEIVPLHRQLQDQGQIEVTTTPYAHPILPLINNTDIAKIGNPKAELPGLFAYPADAEAQLARSVGIYTQAFGRAPVGLWPGEGAVAQPIVSMVAEAGYRWMATGEPVLAKSLGLDQFTRDAKDTVQQADQLYRPYFVQGESGQPVMVIFRDLLLSDKIGFTYSGTPGVDAAADFMQRLENIRAELVREGASGPHLVSVILDGENAWENYPNDGKDFLHALYQQLSESKTVKTVTPSEYLALYPDQKKITYLFPGAWFSANYDTWIGEAEETQAWNYLRQVRAELKRYETSEKTPPSAAALAEAQDFMLLAEGSDWFWWYGADQDSGNDAYFDEGYRALLAKVYTSLGETVPTFVNVPILPARAAAAQTALSGLFTPTVDGAVGPDEWTPAASYTAAGGVQARAEDTVSAVYFGLDKQNLYMRVDSKSDWAAQGNLTLGLYVAAPHGGGTSPISRFSNPASPTVLGFNAANLAEVQIINGGFTGMTYAPADEIWKPVEALASAAVLGSVAEFALPLAALGELETGDELRLAMVITQGERDVQLLPAGGPASLLVPDLGTTTILFSVDDAAGDDHGPGAYAYPTDGVFPPGVFDLKNFTVGQDPKNLVFKFTFTGPVNNVWNSPNGLSVQTLDVYVDKDPGAGTGARRLLPGRNAALPAEDGWDYAIWTEGWTPQFIAPDSQSGEPKQVTEVSFKVIVNAANSTVTLRVPKDAFGEGDPTTWGYVVAVLSQEGYPSAGVWRVRDGQTSAAQWRFGGVPEGATNYPRVFDLLDAGDQAAQLAFTPSTADAATLTVNDLAQVKLLFVK